MERTPALFDIGSPGALFHAIKIAFSNLEKQKAKETDKLLFIIMALNHLREWIAPGYSDIPEKKREAKNNEQRFFKSIGELKEFEIIRSICNHSKHLKPMKNEVDTKYGLSFSEWPSVAAVQSVNNGPPTGYSIDKIDLMDIIRAVITYYSEHWFDKA